MARPERNDVDYFPHPVTRGRKMDIIESKFKNDGYATWYKIIEQLGAANYHFLNLSDEATVMWLAGKCNIDENKLFEIIDILVKLGEFDEEFWRKGKILWNVKFIESIQDAYNRRANDTLSRKDIARINKINVYKNRVNNDVNYGKGGNNPQRKGKERKEEERKEELVYPYNSQEFFKWWELYLKMRWKEHKFKFKSVITEQMALKDLGEISYGAESAAIAIIQKSIKRAWRDLFAIKDGSGKNKRSDSLGDAFQEVDNLDIK